MSKTCGGFIFHNLESGLFVNAFRPEGQGRRLSIKGAGA